MGIPGFYKWLINRYPKTLCSVVDQPDTPFHQPNPNGVEFDNLYIDMNGIIHPCFHPKDQVTPRSYEEIFHFIFVYIDRVFSIVRPRKLLFLAVDGVAPRAKMNHQRIRRFNSAKEAANECIGKPEADNKLDSNVITPGTEFMDLLSYALKYYVYQRVNTEPGWRGIKVILSDSTVVGEGEDKIMSYIRSQRSLPGYDPNTRHCLHGLDADLIMLSLATHEIHISILREAKASKKDRWKNKTLEYLSFMETKMRDLEFEFFNIWVFREYLESELLPNVAGTDFDRLIDDFVLMCIFVGNDYLPHLPSFDISRGGIDLLLRVYQREFVKTSYLTNAHEVNLKSLEHFLQALTQTAIFKRHSEINMKRNEKKRGGFHYSINMKRNKKKRGGFHYSDQIHDSNTERILHYTVNFDCESHDIDRIKRHAVLKYIEGICWVMHSYYQKVPSWQWFYPYHYAPLASDFCGLDKLEIRFTLGQPFKPLDQLLGVLPAARELMINKSSPILDFYPADAEFDRDGKRFNWQGVCKLPFIDESRLLSEIVKLEHTLTDEEKQRNRVGRDVLFVHSSHPLAKLIEDLPSNDRSSELQVQIRPDLSDGMNGQLCISDRPVLPFNIRSPFIDKPAVEMNSVKSVDYKRPSHAHIPKLLHGVIMPPKILRHEDRPCLPVASPYKCLDKKRKRTTLEEKNCKSGDATKADHCVDLDITPMQGLDQGDQQNVINGESEGSQNHLISGKSTNPTQVQQLKAGNGGTSDETQRVDTQIERPKDERLINTGICEKPSTGADESLGDVPRSKRRRKNRNKKKLKSEGHEAAGDVPQAIKITVNSVEEPTIRMESSNNQQEHPVALNHKKDDMMLIDGDKKTESVAAAKGTANVEVANVEDESLGNVPKRKQRRKNKNKKKLETEGPEAAGKMPQGIKITINDAEEPTIRTEPSNNLQEHHHLASKHTKDEMMLIDGEKKTESLAAAEVATNVEVANEDPKNKMGSVGSDHKTDLVRQMKDENMNDIQQETPVALKCTKKRRVKDEMPLTNGNKTESLAAAKAATDIKVGSENPTNKIDSVSRVEPTDLVVGQVNDENINDFLVRGLKSNTKMVAFGKKRQTTIGKM